MLESYIIHYTKLAERKERVVKLLGSYGLNLNLIASSDKEILNNSNIHKVYSIDECVYAYKMVHAYGPCYAYFRVLDLGEISCALKHYMAYKHIVENEHPYALVVEDDAVSTEHLEKGLEGLLGDLPDGWDVIFLGSGIGVDFVEDRIKEFKRVGEFMYKATHPASNCTEAYLISSKAAKLLYNCLLPFHMPLDFEMSYWFKFYDLNVYWRYPSLFEQGSKTGAYESSLRERVV